MGHAIRQVIHKQRSGGAPANMADYERARAQFSWEQARADLAGLPGGGLNMAYEAVDRHAEGALATTVALRFLARDGEVREFTYAELRRDTNRFANVLRALGIGGGERVFTLAGRIPELYLTALGTLKCGAVFCPLFSAFGPGPIEQRLRLGDARVLVTTPALSRGGSSRERRSRRWSPARRDRPATPEPRGAMNEQELREVVVAALTEVAPEIDGASIDPQAVLTEQLDIDSMDFLNFVVAVHEETGVAIPERDYPKLSTLDGAVAYLTNAQAQGGSERP